MAPTDGRVYKPDLAKLSTVVFCGCVRIVFRIYSSTQRSQISICQRLR